MKKVIKSQLSSAFSFWLDLFLPWESSGMIVDDKDFSNQENEVLDSAKVLLANSWKGLSTLVLKAAET